MTQTTLQANTLAICNPYFDTHAMTARTKAICVPSPRPQQALLIMLVESLFVQALRDKTRHATL